MLEMKSLFVFTEVLFQGKKWHFLKKKTQEALQTPQKKAQTHQLDGAAHTRS